MMILRYCKRINEGHELDEDYSLRGARDTGNHYHEGSNLRANDGLLELWSNLEFCYVTSLWFLSSILKCLLAMLLSKPVCMDTENSVAAHSLPDIHLFEH